MDDSALKAALRNLLAHGEAAEDNKLTKLAASKKAPPPAAPEMCPECKVPLENGACAKCGYSAPKADEDDAGLADVLEQGAAEG